MIFTTWLTVVVTCLAIGEALNCKYARYDRDYDSEGMCCQWEESDFDLVEGKYILKKEDPEDNCIEAKVRERYWKE
tara:strand:- start:352 stop:579 length:228 start_codon:yes stop_codon:yes gene_type:complete